MEELIEVTGIKVNIWRGGKGEPLFLLTGWNGHFETYSDFLEELAVRDFDVYGIEFPGSGKSDFPPLDWEFDHFVKLVEEIFAHYQISRAVILGHSYGAVTALRFARFFPHRVTFLILMSAWLVSGGKWPFIKKGKVPLWLFRSLFFLVMVLLPVPARWFLKLILRPVARGFRRHVENWIKLLDLVRFYVTDANGVMRKIFHAFVTVSSEEDAKEVKARTLLLWGSKDLLTPPRNAKILAKCLGDRELVIVEGGRHHPTPPCAEKYAREIANWVQKH